jgi:hypothetical protein
MSGALVMVRAIGGTALVLFLAGCGGNVEDPTGDNPDGGVARAGPGTADGGRAENSGTASAPEAGATRAPSPEWFECTDTSQCRVRMPTCCAGCPPEELSDAVAFNGTHGAAFNDWLCQSQGVDPNGCPVLLCANVEDTNVLPLCIEGRCQAIDIRQSILTSCRTDADCRLRWETVCCESCYAFREELHAVSLLVSYESYICGSVRACYDCPIQPYPADAKAVCDANQRCQVAWLR